MCMCTVHGAHAFGKSHGTKIQFKTIFIDEAEIPFSVGSFSKNPNEMSDLLTMITNVLAPVYILWVLLFVCVWVLCSHGQTHLCGLFAICMKNKALAISGFSIGSNNKSAWVLFVCIDFRIGKENCSFNLLDTPNSPTDKTELHTNIAAGQRNRRFYWNNVQFLKLAINGNPIIFTIDFRLICNQQLHTQQANYPNDNQ